MSRVEKQCGDVGSEIRGVGAGTAVVVVWLAVRGTGRCARSAKRSSAWRDADPVGWLGVNVRFGVGFSDALATTIGGSSGGVGEVPAATVRTRAAYERRG